MQTIRYKECSNYEQQKLTETNDSQLENFYTTVTDHEETLNFISGLPVLR